MNAIRSHHISRRVCLLLVWIMATSLVPFGITGAFAQQPAGKTVLVFPLTNAAEGAPSDIGARATGLLTTALIDVEGLDAMQFSPNSPTVRRAISEGRVRQVDVEEDAGRDLAAALMIGNALRVDYIVLGSIQSFTRKDAPASVEVILAGQMYDVAANINPATQEPNAEPKVFRAFGVSGTSTPRAAVTDERPLVQEALRDAASKVAQTLSGKPQVAGVTHKKETAGAYKWVLLALLVGGLAMAANNGNGGANQPGPEAVPPTNVVLSANAEGGLNLTWQEPTGTTLTVLRYVIDRSVDGGAFTRVDQGSVLRGSTFFNDYNTLNGTHVYQYRIKAVYTQGPVSAYVLSGAFGFTK